MMYFTLNNVENYSPQMHANKRKFFKCLKSLLILTQPIRVLAYVIIALLILEHAAPNIGQY